jgi:predicted alpha/beta-fold hydrolase
LAPRLVVLHGLEGTIRSHYVRGILERAHALGWGADFLIFRSCGSELNRARRFYHSGETTDLAFLVRRVLDQYPKAPLLFAGYSLGGNVLLKWLGEQGDDLPPHAVAAVAVSVPFDLEESARHVSRGVSRLYEVHFLRTLKSKALAKLQSHPDLFTASALASATTLRRFDDTVTAPVHGFRDAHDYYEQSSSLRFLHTIRLPTLLLSAYDDPFLPAQELERVAGIVDHVPALEAEFHPRGGHVGFVSGTIPGRASYYAEDRAISFFCHHLERQADYMVTG